MSFLKKLVSFGMTLVAALTIVLVLQAPASAANAWDCPPGVGCVYNDANGGGGGVQLPWSFYGGGKCYYLGAPLWHDNAVSSATIDYGNNHYLILWYSSNCGGVGYYQMSPHTHVNFVWPDNDSFSSFQLV